MILEIVYQLRNSETTCFLFRSLHYFMCCRLGLPSTYNSATSSMQLHMYMPLTPNILYADGHSGSHGSLHFHPRHIAFHPRGCRLPFCKIVLYPGVGDFLKTIVCTYIVLYFFYIREGQSRAKVLSNMIKQKRKEKAVSWL